VDGVEKILSFIENNRFNSDLLHLLASSVLSHDNHQPIRGYVHISHQSEELDVHCDLANPDIEPLFFLIEDIVSSPVQISADLLELESFTAALVACGASLRLIEPGLDLAGVLERGECWEPYTREGMLVAAAVHICLLDCLEAAGVELEGVAGCGVSEVIAAYVDGCLSLDQCFQAINCIGR